jgi:hypothetical protein
MESDNLCPGGVVIDEGLLFPTENGDCSSGPLIRTLEGLEEVRELGASRFGAVRLYRRSCGAGYEYFAVKFYGAGDRRQSQLDLENTLRKFLSLRHPRVMPIDGLIAPRHGVGPVVLTPYSPGGSLADLLWRVPRSDPPPGWGNAMKLRMIVSLTAGLVYLHHWQVVDSTLKPSDLIIQADRSFRICGYLTTVFEEMRFTRVARRWAVIYSARTV